MYFLVIQLPLIFPFCLVTRTVNVLFFHNTFIHGGIQIFHRDFIRYFLLVASSTTFYST